MYGPPPDDGRPWWRKMAGDGCDWLAFLIGAAFACHVAGRPM